MVGPLVLLILEAMLAAGYSKSSKQCMSVVHYGESERHSRTRSSSLSLGQCLYTRGAGRWRSSENHHHIHTPPPRLVTSSFIGFTM